MAECKVMPATLLEMLASTLMKDAQGNIFFNQICYEIACADMTPAIECGENLSDLEAYIVANGFGVDECGNAAIKLRVCVEADSER